MKNYQDFISFTSKFGSAGSWAIWDPPGDAPKSNTDGMNWVTPDLWKKVKTEFVFVGLNLSRALEKTKKKQNKEPWSNFHSSQPYQNDYKLRYALSGTQYWGSYLTDLIKFKKKDEPFEEVKSGEVIKELKKNPEIIKDNVLRLKEELGYFKNKPILVAMGTNVFKLLKENLGSEYHVVKIKHYSCHMGKEKYREEALKVLDSINK